MTLKKSRLADLRCIGLKPGPSVHHHPWEPRPKQQASAVLRSPNGLSLYSSFPPQGTMICFCWEWGKELKQLR